MVKILSDNHFSNYNLHCNLDINRRKVRQLLHRYGHNPNCYISLERDKLYFFGTGIEGVIVYVIENKTAVCAGDPICAYENCEELIIQFKKFCKENRLSLCFYNTTNQFEKIFKELYFKKVKIAEDVIFDIQSYTTTGKNAGKVRQKINAANREGIEVVEYKPKQIRSGSFEKQITEVSKEWIFRKPKGEFSFMLGSLGLDNPMDRRYFIALDQYNNVQGFTVFVPYLGGKGYYLDIARTRQDVLKGTSEKLIVTAFQKFKKEGVQWGSLGLVPMTDNTKIEDYKETISNKLVYGILKKFSNYYGTNTLYRYKKKFAPSEWDPRYVYYTSTLSLPKVISSVLKAENLI